MQSGNTMVKPHMDVVCVLDINQSDNLVQRRKAFDEVRLACLQIGANFNHIQVCCDKIFLGLFKPLPHRNWSIAS